eukprot:2049099-Rhodomonas_salina.1
MAKSPTHAPKHVGQVRTSTSSVPLFPTHNVYLAKTVNGAMEHTPFHVLHNAPMGCLWPYNAVQLPMHPV